MQNKSLWASTEEACSAVGISRTRLYELRVEGELLGGKHWVYLSGRRNSPLGWDIQEIRTWQKEKAQQISEAPLKAAEEIEDYAPMGV